MTEPQKSGGKPDRDASGRFLPGHTKAGPGRPGGSVSLTTKLRRRLQEQPEEEFAVLDSLLEAAKTDQRAREYLINRLDGMPTQRTQEVVPVSLEWTFEDASDSDAPGPSGAEADRGEPGEIQAGVLREEVEENEPSRNGRNGKGGGGT